MVRCKLRLAIHFLGVSILIDLVRRNAEEAERSEPSTQSYLLPNRLTQWQAILVLVLIAQTLFTVGLQHPAKPFFDEVHYVPAARDLINGVAYRNQEHPLLAKFLIGISMLLFGDNPIGWRAFSTVMGSATVVAVFLIAQNIFKDVRSSFIAGLLTILNQMVFIHARIAMLDVYMGAFLLLGLALLMSGHDAVSQKSTKLKIMGAGALFGLAIGSKWAAVPYLLIAITCFLFIRFQAARAAGFTLRQFLLSERLPAWPGMSTARAVVYLAGVASLTYLATFAPAFFVEENRMSFWQLLPQQLEIYERQTRILAPHNYASQWWQWPQIGRPIWYYYERLDGVLRGVLLVGNPAIMWGGMIAVIVSAIGGIRSRDRRLLMPAMLFLFSYGIWVLIPKNPSFYYYYYLPSVFLPIALVAVFDRYCRRGVASLVPPLFIFCSILLFIYFYPIISAAPLREDGDYLNWMWFESWK